MIVPTHNASDSIGVCLRKILDQSHTNIEVLICDDASTDDTLALVDAIGDTRIRILRGDINRGPSAARNRGIRQAAGEILFFTDDDVEVDRDWVLNGLHYFDDRATVGIEGKIIYVSSDYSPRYSDRIVQNLHGGEYMAANVAYRKAALEQAGLFDEALRQYEDRELALRASRLGRVAFAKDSVVFHMRDRYDMRGFMREAREVGLSLDFKKRQPESANRCIRRIIYPSHLITILFPPLILGKLLIHPRPDRRDMLMLSLIYPRLIFERYIIWRWALRNRIFVI